MWNTFPHWWKQGIVGMWRGSIANVTRAFQAKAFQAAAGRTIRDWCPDSDRPLSRLWSINNTHPPSTPHWACEVSAWDDLWSPAMFGHVHAQSVTLEYAWTGRRARGLRTVASVSMCIYLWCWHGDLVSDCRTTGPSPPHVCSLVRDLIVWRPGGGITPGMIPYYWAGPPFRSLWVLLVCSGFSPPPWVAPLSPALWCPHRLTTTPRSTRNSLTLTAHFNCNANTLLPLNTFSSVIMTKWRFVWNFDKYGTTEQTRPYWGSYAIYIT